MQQWPLFIKEETLVKEYDSMLNMLKIDLFQIYKLWYFMNIYFKTDIKFYWEYLY